jgi:NADH dehydrogenase
MPSGSSTNPEQRIVVIGGGFGGLTAVQELAGAPVSITVIDQRNHHLFQPLLYQIATAALSPADIAAPIRSIIGRLPRVEVILGEVTGIDTANQLVRLRDAGTSFVPYDRLIVATGARHSYFGHDEWAAHAPGLKTIEDATFIRRKILLAFERAEAEPDLLERQRLLTFVVVGGGPTGVEMAGAISDLARNILARDFHTINPRSASVILVEAGPRVLAAFAQDLSDYAQRSLQRLGVEIRVNTTVTGITADEVQTSAGTINTRTAIWAAGVRASDAGRWLGAETDRNGRVKVTDRLTVPHHPEIFVIGDTASVTSNGKPVPGLAPAAKAQGRYVARAIRQGDIGPFQYHHEGDLATIGRRSAVIQRGKLHLTGFFAWLLWGVAHIFFLIGFRNRIVVTIDWLWSYLTFHGGARLITDIHHTLPDKPQHDV